MKKVLTIILLFSIMVLSVIMLSKDNIVNEEYHRYYNPAQEVGDLNIYINESKLRR